MKLAAFPLTVVVATCISSVGVAQNLQWGLGTTYPLTGQTVNPTSMCAGDVNGDGRKDLVVGNGSNAPSIWVALAQTSGGLQISGQSLAGGSAIMNVGLGQLTVDHNLDLAFNYQGSTAFTWQGMGNGSFGAATGLVPDGPTWATIVADFNLDGFDDVATIRCIVTNDCSTRVVCVYYSNAGNGFFLPISLGPLGPLGPVGLPNSPFVAGDLDGDGDPDILVATPQQLTIFTNDGVGVFSRHDYARGTVALMAVGDMDGDGRADIVTFGGPTSALQILWSDPNHMLLPATVISNVNLVSMKLGDIDGDGRLDIAVFDISSPEHVGLIRNLGGRSFAAPVIIPSPILIPAPLNSFAMALADVAGDARPELVLLADKQLRVFQDLAPDCNGNGLDDPAEIAAGTTTDCDANGVPDTCQGDCNNNGTPDVCEIAANASLDLNSNWQLDACESLGTPYCFGDGSGLPCPCDPGQAGATGNGCMNSTGSSGRLRAFGNGSFSLDSVTLRATGLPTFAFGLFFQGNVQQAAGLGSTFGDGLLCVNQSVIRLGIRHASGGAFALGRDIPGDQPVHVLGQIPATGATRHYQVWYRDAASFCTASTYNLTNGLSVSWQP